MKSDEKIPKQMKEKANSYGMPLVYYTNEAEPTVYVPQGVDRSKVTTVLLSAQSQNMGEFDTWHKKTGRGELKDGFVTAIQKKELKKINGFITTGITVNDNNPTVKGTKADQLVYALQGREFGKKAKHGLGAKTNKYSCQDGAANKNTIILESALAVMLNGMEYLLQRQITIRALCRILISLTR